MSKNNRQAFKHQNRIIYQWQQSLDSIIMYVVTPQLPSNIKLSNVFQVKIKSKSVTIGIKGNPPYLSHETQGIIDKQESVWYIQDCQKGQKQKRSKQIVIQLLKAQKGIRWGCLFKGHKNSDPFQEQELKKKLMLQRFQEEHPGFDFSSAQFNGKVPQARQFMGGVKYN